MSLLQRAQRLGSSYQYYIALFFSALFTCLAFTPYEFWVFGFISLVPLLLYLKHNHLSLKEALTGGIFFSVVLNGISYPWMIHTLQEYGYMSLPAALFVFLIYCVAVSGRYIVFLIFCYVLAKVKSKREYALQTLLLYPTFWVLAEFLTWQLFPWYGGNILSTNIYLMQYAEFVGVFGLSWIWVMISCCFLYLLEKNTLKYWLVGCLCLFAFHYPGKHLYDKNVKEISAANTIPVAIIQGSSPMKWEPNVNVSNDLARIIDEISSLSISAFEKSLKNKPIKLIVWPESAVPFLSYEDSNYLQARIHEVLARTNTPLLINDSRLRDQKTYSNISLFDSTAVELENYQKIYLLPFGEYIPLGETFPYLYQVFPEVSDFVPGSRKPLFKLKGFSFQVFVCYEVIVPSFALNYFQSLPKKPDILVNLTNDTWFGDTFETEQHLQLSKLRAVEFRKPLLRAANSGISGYITPTGELERPTALFEKDFRIYDVPVSLQKETLFSRFGNFPLLVILCIQLIWQSKRLRE